MKDKEYAQPSDSLYLISKGVHGCIGLTSIPLITADYFLFPIAIGVALALAASRRSVREYWRGCMKFRIAIAMQAFVWWCISVTAPFIPDNGWKVLFVFAMLPPIYLCGLRTNKVLSKRFS